MNNVKYIIVILWIAFIATVKAQQPKIDEVRTRFIAQKLMLSEPETKKFWPLYNEYLDKIKAVRQERKKLFSKNIDFADKKLSEEFVGKKLQFDALENRLHKEYTEKFLTLLGTEKTARLLKAEEDFRLELVKILKDKPDSP